ncbi:adenylate/guanylate cyclase domain-containing protein [Terasakiella sp. SH-1]|uniref:adenylate/guanylate cyclase domain-containing protein n=1 Tax=Terasakiella sp. SH-1 TaxID=2560057 RepID=UPI001073134A|nr:adenylate/guanylate cyclase domain-containing protein [Terasakiella sp. SH-1]
MGNNDNQTYEVQVYNNGRWQSHARYPYHERANAIADAKELDHDKIGVAVRVLLEDYNPSNGLHTESLIYRNKIKPQKKKIARTRHSDSWADLAVSSDGRIGYQSDDVEMFLAEGNLQDRPKAPVTTPMFLGVLFTIIAVGLGGGGGAAGLLYLMIKGFNVAAPEHIQKFLIMGMFVLVFLIAASSTYAHYAARFDLNPFKKKKKTPPPVAPPTKISQDMEKAAQAIDKMEPAEPPIQSDEEFDIFDLIDERETETEEEIKEVEFSENAEEQKMFLITFLGTVLGALKGPDVSLETLNRFGLNLFISGAVLRIAKDKTLSEEETALILRRLIEMLGAKPEQAERFVSDFDKHLENPRHILLFKKSGDIAAALSNGDPTASLHIREVMEEWVNWKPPVEEHINPNLLTIMFTDMVGSTDLTTKHGDYAAQEVLKAHDLIVRTAITNFEGKEIKHLGDGIMASFKDYHKALEAAVEIHKRVEGNNNAGPEFPLHIRMGLHAGEPIRKNNDLFGTAVQLAARICDFSNSDSISVSQDLVDLCGEKPIFTFIDLGPQELKGFENPANLFKLDWTAPPLEYHDEEDDENLNEESNNTNIAQPAPQAHDGIALDMEVVAPPTQALAEDFDTGLPVKSVSEPKT